MTHEGGCACGKVRFRVAEAPFAVHCCHCRSCQRETGSAFALNGLVEAEHVSLVQGEVERVETPSQSGKGQSVMRCPECKVALWSYYGGMGEKCAFFRTGVLDDPDACPPDLHIFTRSKQAWLPLPEGANVREGYYSQKDYDALFGEERAARYRAMRGI